MKYFQICFITIVVMWLAGCGNSGGSARVSEDALACHNNINCLNANESAATAFLTSVAYHDGLILAVGANGVVSRSNHGLPWTPSLTNIADHLLGVTYGYLDGTGVFMAVGLGGGIFTSSDGGATWATIPSNTVQDLRGIVYADNKFVAVGNEGTILTTGFWGWQTATTGTTMPLFAVTYGNGTFVAVGGNGNEGTILTSPDGVSWVSKTSGVNTALYAVTYANTAVGFVAVGESGVIVTSKYGTTWESQVSGVTYTLTGIKNNSGNLVATAENGGTILVSQDGVNWSPQALSGTEHNLYGITVTPNQIIAVGESGTIVNSVVYSFTSKPGVFSNINLNDIVYAGNDKFFVIGNNSIYQYDSQSGQESEVYHGGSGPNLSAIATNGGGTFVAVGPAGVVVTSINNGASWVDKSGATTEALNAVSYFGGKFIAVGHQIAITSAAGLDWSVTANHTNPKVGPYNLLSIASGADQFMIMGYDDTQGINLTAYPMFAATTSEYNSATWQPSVNYAFPAEHNISAPLKNIFYGSSLFVTVGESGQIFTTTPGEALSAWTSQNSHTTNNFYKGAYANGTYFAVGDNGTVDISNDGVDWVNTPETNGTQDQLRSIACSNDVIPTTCVAVGDSGAVGIANNAVQLFTKVAP